MIYLLNRSSYSDEENNSDNAIFTKWYQHIEVNKSGSVGEIGAHSFFDNLVAFSQATLSVIDPYNSAPGAGMARIPDNIPYPIILFRCLVGEDSSIIPDCFFDITFSISVIEHIGQAEAQYDCNPTDTPPLGQERPREAFCKELFRITKPGGITFHTVDHAARNLSFVQNFLNNGFELLDNRPIPTTDSCLHSPDAIRQKRAWHHHELPMSEEEQSLNAVLMMAFRRPA